MKLDKWWVKALFGCLLSVTSLTSLAETYHWQFANLYGRGTAFGSLYDDFAHNIEQMSQGRMEVQVVYSSEGVGISGIFDAVKADIVEMAAPFQPMYEDELPVGVVELGLPGFTSDVNKLESLIHSKGWGGILKQAYADQGLVWLEPYIQPAVYIITKKPIFSLKDFKGMRIRALGAYSQFLKQLGAIPVAMAWSEIYSSLASGTIDGAIGSNLIDHRDAQNVEVAKYMYPLPLAGAQILPVLVNQKEWLTLPDDLKTVVQLAAEKHAREQITQSKQWESQAISDMEAKGLQWSPEPSASDKAKWQAIAKAVSRQYARQDAYSKALIDILNTQ